MWARLLALGHVHAAVPPPALLQQQPVLAGQTGAFLKTLALLAESNPSARSRSHACDRPFIRAWNPPGALLGASSAAWNEQAGTGWCSRTWTGRASLVKSDSSWFL